MGISRYSKYFGLFGVILFIYILWRVGIYSIVSEIYSADVLFIFFSLPMLIITILLKSLRWKMILKTIDINLSWKECTIIWLKGFFWGIITPGRIGDFSRCIFLKDIKGTSLGESALTVVIDRIFDILVLFGLNILGVLTLLYLFDVEILSIKFLISFSIIFIFFLYVLTNREIVKRISAPFVDLLVPQKFKKETKYNFNQFYEGVELLARRKYHLLGPLLVSIFSWLAISVGSYSLALSLSLDISYWHLLIFTSIGSTISLVPISISGLGTREVTLIFLFSIVNITSQQAVSFSLMFFAWTFFPALAGSILYLLKI